MFFSAAYFNPYHGETFFGVIVTFFYRLWLFVTGRLPTDQLMPDEIQIGVLAGVAVSSALVGAFLVLRKMAMLANSLSHTILLGIVLAYFFTSGTKGDTGFIAPMQAMLLASLGMGFLTAFLTEFLTTTGQLQEDASMGLIFTSFFAIGIILVTILTRDAHIGLEAVMGNADALNQGDFLWVYLILLANVVIITLFFKEFTLTTFDTQLATALGFSPVFFNYLLMAQVSSTAIVSFRAVGVLLVLAFMTGPPLIARLLTNRLKPMLWLSAAIGLLAVIVGVAFTRHVVTVYGSALSTSGVVVCVILVFYLLAICFAPERGLLPSAWSNRRRGSQLN